MPLTKEIVGSAAEVATTQCAQAVLKIGMLAIQGLQMLIWEDALMTLILRKGVVSKAVLFPEPFFIASFQELSTAPGQRQCLEVYGTALVMLTMIPWTLARL